MDYSIDDKWVGRLGLLILGVLVARTLLVYRATGRFPVRFNDTSTAHGFNHAVLFAVIVAFAANLILMRLPRWLSREPVGDFGNLYDITGPLISLQLDAVRLAGLILSTLALCLAGFAQHQMGSSWRIGLDTGHKTDLVTSGLFRSARHPIYFALILLGLGLFLAMPSALTGAALAVLVVVLSIQTRLEEEFLRASHGESYKAYYARTRRWI